MDVTHCIFCAFFQSFVLLAVNKDGGGGATAGGRNIQAAPHSVAVCEQISEMKLTDGIPGQNDAV